MREIYLLFVNFAKREPMSCSSGNGVQPSII